MQRKNECVLAATSELDAAGIQWSIENSKKHVKIRWHHNGAERNFVVAASPSDWRAPLNSRSDIRKVLQKDLTPEGNELVPAEPRILTNDTGPFCTSRDLAAHFGKRHAHVLREIANLTKEIDGPFTEPNFGLSEYTDSTGRKLPEYRLSRDGFTLLAMGFTGAEATQWKIKYLSAFNLMEARLRGTSTLSGDALFRIERLEGDLAALIDLSLGAQAIPDGFVLIKPHLRKRRTRK